MLKYKTTAPAAFRLTHGVEASGRRAGDIHRTRNYLFLLFFLAVGFFFLFPFSAFCTILRTVAFV